MQQASASTSTSECSLADWQEADAQLGFLARGRHQLDHETGRALVRALRSRAHEHLGFGSFAEYVERRFGFRPRYTRERLRVALALEDLPLIDEALQEGSITWSAAREITRVADEACEAAWLACATQLAPRDLETRVARHVRGEAPTDPPHPDTRRHVLRFEVSGHVYALWREVEAKLREEHGEDMDPDETFALVARRILEGPGDEGRASYQIAVATCPECRETTQVGRGEAVRLDATDAEMTECDAQRIDEKGHAHQDIPPAVRRQVLRRDGGRCAVPGCRNSLWLDIHHIVLRAEGGDHDPDNLITLCGTHHRAQHRGSLIISGCVSAGVTYQHANGSAYGTVGDPVLAGMARDVFQILRKWGVSERDAKRAVAAATHVGRPMTLEEAVRLALAELPRSP